MRELNLKKTEVATIASWNKIPYAVEKEKGSTFVNAGVQEIREGEIDEVTQVINHKQKQDEPSWDGRKDEYTFAQAIQYLKNNKPRFLYISLNDSDEHAHSGKYSKYIETLKWYDEKIQTLFDTLDSLGDYGKSTSVIITTDHGRGNGREWRDHDTDSPESKFIWIYGRTPTLKKSTQRATVSATGYTHLDIRPTIEKLMGLTPLQCDECGKVIVELLPPSEAPQTSPQKPKKSPEEPTQKRKRRVSPRVAVGSLS